MILAVLLLFGQAPENGALISIQSLQQPGYTIIDRVATSLSKGSMIHSAVVLDGYVYEAVKPRVRKTPWDSWHWLERKTNHIIWVLNPTKPYSEAEIASMKAFAESQLGRIYRVRGLWQHRETLGTFCSKLASEIYECSGRLSSLHYQETPQTLWCKLLLHSKQPILIDR